MREIEWARGRSDTAQGPVVVVDSRNRRGAPPQGARIVVPLKKESKSICVISGPPAPSAVGLVRVSVRKTRRLDEVFRCCRPGC